MDHLRRLFKWYWESGTHLAVDESIIQFTGRSAEIVNIPTKPTPEGFKVWILANQGYVLDFIYHAKGEHKGPWDLDLSFIKEEGFTHTQAVVLDLLAQLDNNGKDHIVWLDNLFTDNRLLERLRDVNGAGAAGTVRAFNTRREVIEEAEIEAEIEPGNTQLSDGSDADVLNVRSSKKVR